MDLEPAVLQTLRRKRTVLRLHQAGILLMLALGLCALLLLVIVPFSAGNTTFSPLVNTSGMSWLVWAGLIIAALIGGAGFALYFWGRYRDLSFYATFTRRTKEYDRGELGRVLNSLDDAASAAGTKAPYLAVLDGDVPNAVAFEGAEGVVIGITAGALDAGLEPAHVRSVMAHEMADVVSGDYLRPPGASKFEGAALALLWLTALLGILTVPIVRRGNSALYAFLVALAIIGFLILASLWLRAARNAGEHDHILADSIAVKLTGDPMAMKSSLERMDTLVNKRARSLFPESELGLRNLFMPPRKWSEDAMSYMRRRSEALGYDMKEAAARRRADALQAEMDDLAEWAEQLLADRLENIDEIQLGNWHSFS
jgi:Zn-dependent protease with chaperone function